MGIGLRTGGASAYQSVAAWTSVGVDDPRRLVVMLYDGALDRIRHARGCAEHGMAAEKSAAIGRAIAILDELRGSLDFENGGPLAANLEDLYSYASRRLLAASATGDVRILDEVAALLRELREAWAAIAAAPAAP
jgi:flagellar protein FliS